MDNNLNEHILDKITKTCTCKGISRLTIKDSIKEGNHTVADVAKATGACTGGCKGFRCTPIIEDLIQKHLNEQHN